MITDQAPVVSAGPEIRTSQEQIAERKTKSSQHRPSKMIGDYKMVRDLGEGTFGKVKLGQHVETKQWVAIKVLEKKKIA